MTFCNLLFFLIHTPTHLIIFCIFPFFPLLSPLQIIIFSSLSLSTYLFYFILYDSRPSLSLSLSL